MLSSSSLSACPVWAATRLRLSCTEMQRFKGDAFLFGIFLAPLLFGIRFNESPISDRVHLECKMIQEVEIIRPTERPQVEGMCSRPCFSAVVLQPLLGE